MAKKQVIESAVSEPTGEQLNAAVVKWAASGQKWLDQGQALLLAAFEYMQRSEDRGPICAMYTRLPKGMKRDAMGEWLLTFTPLTARPGEEGKTDPFMVCPKKASFFKDAAYCAEMMKKAAEHPWYLMGKPDKALDEIFDVDKALTKALMSVMSAAAKAKGTTDDRKLTELAEWAHAHGIHGLPMKVAPQTVASVLSDLG